MDDLFANIFVPWCIFRRRTSYYLSIDLSVCLSVDLQSPYRGWKTPKTFWRGCGPKILRTEVSWPVPWQTLTNFWSNRGRSSTMDCCTNLAAYFLNFLVRSVPVLIFVLGHWSIHLYSNYVKPLLGGRNCGWNFDALFVIDRSLSHWFWQWISLLNYELSLCASEFGINEQDVTEILTGLLAQGYIE